VWEAKGDIVSHGASAFERVIVGADDTVLIADSSAASGLSWGQVGSDQISAGAVTETELDSSVVQQLVPVGTIAATIRSSADAGWALMGTTVTNAENNYPALWAVAPAGWQSGSDLVLPDMSDRYLSGKSSTDTLGAEVGSNDVTLATANLPSHTHSGPSHSHTINHGHGHNIQAGQSAHTHSVDPSSTSVTINANDLDMVYNTGSYTNTNYIATDTSITDPSGNHPYYVPSAFGMAVASTTSHTHTGTVDIASFTSGPTDPAIVMSGGVTDHSGSSGSAGTGATGATGDGDSFSIQSAHLVVNFQLKIL
jgi:microcystin-dependent protein